MLLIGCSVELLDNGDNSICSLHNSNKSDYRDSCKKLILRYSVIR